jgi:hypothetical protein
LRNIKDLASMNKMTHPNQIHGKSISGFGSRFERLEAAARVEKSLQAQLGAKLRKVFPPPNGDNTPDPIKHLLQEIKDKFE